MQRQDMDWILKDLTTGVPHTRHVVVLSSDGLPIAELSTVDGQDSGEDADHIAAACSALQSLATALGSLLNDAGPMRMQLIEWQGGFFYLMAAGQGAYLGVLADQGVDAALMGQQMRDLVARIGEHLSSAPRSDIA